MPRLITHFKFVYPVDFTITTDNKSKDFVSKFCLNDWEVAIELIHNDWLGSASDSGDIDYYFSTCSKIEFKVTSTSKSIDAERHDKICKCCIRIIKYVIERLNYIGFVLHQKLPNKDKDYYMYHLRIWKFQYLIKNEWKHLAPRNLFTIGFNSLYSDYLKEPIPVKGRLANESWNDVTESLSSDEEINYMSKFISKSIEYMNIGDYKLATLEVIVLLEMVVTRYMRAYYENQFGYSKEIINTIVSPAFTLYHRVIALIPFMLPYEMKKDIEFKDIAKCIKWRNTIIHEDGAFPEGIPKDEARMIIFKTINLCTKLGSYKYINK